MTRGVGRWSFRTACDQKTAAMSTDDLEIYLREAPNIELKAFKLLQLEAIEVLRPPPEGSPSRGGLTQFQQTWSVQVEFISAACDHQTNGCDAG